MMEILHVGYIYRFNIQAAVYILYFHTESNAFGNVNFTYRIQHYPNVIPAKPLNLTLVSKTSESALLY